MTIASMRIHEVAPLKQVQDEHNENPEEAARNLWGWVSPQAVARACLASVEGDKFKGHESAYSSQISACIIDKECKLISCGNMNLSIQSST